VAFNEIQQQRQRIARRPKRSTPIVTAFPTAPALIALARLLARQAAQDWQAPLELQPQ
jgi:hypothetical protein